MLWLAQALMGCADAVLRLCRGCVDKVLGLCRYYYLAVLLSLRLCKVEAVTSICRCFADMSGCCVGY
jgi:hypothetical protein